MKRIISILMVVVMVVTLLPVNVFAAAAEPTISVQSTSAQPGTTIDVDIQISNNPGIVSTQLTCSFADRLTLVGAKAGDAFSELALTMPAQLKRGESMTGSANFTWLTSELTEAPKDGTILTLSFLVAENATLDKDYAIQLLVGATGLNDGSRANIVVEGGSITIIDYLPGDADQNGSINMIDVLSICQYIVDNCRYDENGYAIRLKDAAADVNGEEGIDMMDVLFICRYIVDNCITDPAGYNIKLLPSTPKCEHEMTATAAVDATCDTAGNIAYWSCAKCGKYYTDADGNGRIALEDTVIAALGHDPIDVDEVPATSTTDGYTAGVLCKRCATWLSGHEVIEALKPNESTITYQLYYVKDSSGEITTDQYLKQQQITNPNPNTYVEGTGTGLLEEPSAAGYEFLGWYELPESSAKRVYSISADSTGNIVLYAIWRKAGYTITYLPDSSGSTLSKIQEETYTTDKETALQVPVWDNLVWIGWSDEDGNIIKSIPKGSSGNISLTANWMSRRNQTVPNTKYASTIPAIVEDPENGIYAFTYEIGDIQNVPIQQVEEGVNGKGFNLVKGQTHEIDKTFTQKIEQGEAVNIANTIANATTKSDSWTLSEDWNKSTSFSEEHANEVTEEQSSKAQLAFSQSNKHTLGAGFGRTKEHIDETGMSTKTTNKHELGVNVNVGRETSLSANLGKGLSLGSTISGALGLDYKYTHEKTDEHYKKHTDKTTSSWNIDVGFETSKSMSASQEFSRSLSQSIKDTYSYGEVLDFGGSESQTVSSSNTSSEERQYSSSVTYSTETGNEITVKETLTGEADTGFYRKVLAANFRVFAVVIYDVKTSTFSTMTYSLKIKDSEHLFTDYSLVSSFDDYENGVLPFEVPSFVGEYIYSIVGKSDGLRINDETGLVEGYGFKEPSTGICYKHYDEETDEYSDPCDTDVVIPQYIVVDIDKNTKKIVPVTGISASAFSGTTVTTVYLNNGITSIPAGAFEDCTSLKYVTGGEINSIGDRAFKGCTSLYELSLSSKVTSIGDSAFEGIPAVSIAAANANIVDAAMKSGAKSISLDLTAVKTGMDGKALVTPDGMTRFEIIGGGNTYNNLSIESTANTTSISNIVINSKGGIPLKLTSPSVSLGYTTVTSSGLVMQLGADSTVVTLDGNNYIKSSSSNAVLCQNLKLIEKSGSSAIGKLNVTGNILIYGKVTGASQVNFSSSDYSFVYLTAEEYDKYLNSVRISFNANGGTCEQAYAEVMFGSPIDALPTPTRDYHTFDGWFTEANGGTEITSGQVLNTVGDITLYAHWTLNPGSDWVLASEVPEGAEVLDRKWSYDLTTTMDSKETSVEGYTQTGSEWIKSGSGSFEYSDKFSTYAPGFDTSNSIYKNMKKSPYSAYETDTEKRTVSNSWKGYVYWHWMYNCGNASATDRSIFYKSAQGTTNLTGNQYGYKFFGAFKSTTNFSGQTNANWGQNDTYYKWYHVTDRSSYASTQGSYWWYRFDYYTCSYVDYYKLFHYTKTESLESATEISEGDGISNIQEWVLYRAK